MAESPPHPDDPRTCGPASPCKHLLCDLLPTMAAGGQRCGVHVDKQTIIEVLGNWLGEHYPDINGLADDLVEASVLGAPPHRFELVGE